MKNGNHFVPLAAASIFVLLIFGMSGCGFSNRQGVEAAGREMSLNTQGVRIGINDAAVKPGSGALELKLSYVSIDEMSIHEAITKIQYSVLKSTNGKIRLGSSVQSSSYLAGEGWALKIKKVKFEAENISLKSLLDDICHQAGWSYRLDERGISFVDDARFFQ